MKLQIAVDRVSLQHALDLARAVKGVVDIFEVGTSLIKDYGMDAVQQIRQQLPNTTLLADIKTMDEGAYEFEAAYDAGGNLATVMGAASLATVSACYEVAKQRQRDIMIDLLEVSDERIKENLLRFDEALFCVHLSVDGGEEGVEAKLQHFVKSHPNLSRVAVAGGVRLEQVPVLKKHPVEVCVVGSAITKAESPRTAAEKFYQALHA